MFNTETLDNVQGSLSLRNGFDSPSQKKRYYLLTLNFIQISPNVSLTYLVSFETRGCLGQKLKESYMGLNNTFV